MVQTGAGANIIFRQAYNIQIADINHKAHEYFGLTGTINVVSSLSNPLVVLDLLHLATRAKEVQNFYDKLHSDMIAKTIECSIIKKSLKKLRLNRGEYE